MNENESERVNRRNNKKPLINFVKLHGGAEGGEEEKIVNRK
jgi:hypothetical protein